MPTTTLEYPKLPFNTVKRYDTRASYALQTIHRLINSSPILHVSFTDPKSPFPAVIPLIGQLGSFNRPSASEEDVLDLYLHSYVSARIMNLAREVENSTGEDGSKPKGLPVTVTASFVDGLVLALTPNAHSYNYRSATLFGYATIVTNVEEKLYAMELITNGVVPCRWPSTRVPPNGKEMASTAVLKVKITSGSGKIREGTTHDDKDDMADEEVLNRVWVGVVPTYQTMGEPIAAPYNRAEMPSYLQEFVEEGNESAKGAAAEAVMTEMRNIA